MDPGSGIEKISDPGWKKVGSATLLARLSFCHSQLLILTFKEFFSGNLKTWVGSVGKVRRESTSGTIQLPRLES